MSILKVDTINSVAGNGITFSDGAQIGRNKNIKIVRASATTITVTADCLTVYDSNNFGRIISSVSRTLTPDNTGADGRATDETLAVGWWYIYAIYNGSSQGVIASQQTSFASVTVPAGYSWGALIGAFYVASLSSTVIRDFKQFDDVVIQAGTDQWVLTAGTATSYTSIDFTNEFPKIVKTAMVGIAIVHTGSDGVMWLSPVSDGSLGEIQVDHRVGGNEIAIQINLFFDQSNASYPIYYYKIESGDSGYLGYTNQFTIEIG